MEKSIFAAVLLLWSMLIIYVAYLDLKLREIEKRKGA
jgi:hypothetical protein